MSRLSRGKVSSLRCPYLKRCLTEQGSTIREGHSPSGTSPFPNRLLLLDLALADLAPSVLRNMRVAIPRLHARFKRIRADGDTCVEHTFVLLGCGGGVRTEIARTLSRSKLNNGLWGLSGEYCGWVQRVSRKCTVRDNDSDRYGQGNKGKQLQCMKMFHRNALPSFLEFLKTPEFEFLAARCASQLQA